MCAREISHLKRNTLVAFRNFVYLLELFSANWTCFRCVLLATKIPLIFIDWKWTIPFFIPPYGFKLKSLLQLIFDLLNRCTWHFQPSVGTSRSVNLPIRNVVYFSDVIVRMKSRWRCQHPFVHPCADVLENFCVCWDMLLWDEIINVNILKSRRGEAFNSSECLTFPLGFWKKKKEIFIHFPVQNIWRLFWNLTKCSWLVPVREPVTLKH